MGVNEVNAILRAFFRLPLRRRDDVDDFAANLIAHGLETYNMRQGLFVVTDEGFAGGALGDDSQDNAAAFLAAQQAAAAAGGGIVLIPQGIYRLSTWQQPPSGVSMIGAGSGATILKNTSSVPPFNNGIFINGLLGANYAINAPASESVNTVTTTVAADAGNFAPGEDIAITGALVGFDYIPFIVTQVVSAVPGTGVITIKERLRRTDVTRVHKIPSVPQNITLQGFSLESTGAADSALVVRLARNVTIRDIRVGPNWAALGAGLSITNCRDVFIRENRFDGHSISMHGCVDCVVDANTVLRDSIKLEGGCQDCKIINNSVVDPPGNGIQALTKCLQNVYAFNTIRNVLQFTTGIALTGDVGGYGDNVVIGNTVSGRSGASPGSGIVMVNNCPNNIVVGNRLRNLDTGVGVQDLNSSGNLIRGNRCTACGTDYQFINGAFPGHDDAIGATGRVQTSLTYSASITPDGRAGDDFALTVTDGLPFTINNASNLRSGQRIQLIIANNSGGAMGLITWGIAYKMAAWVNPANGFIRAIQFRYNGSVLREINRTTADAPV